ncbi:MAG: hypothetical protein LBT38_05540 [Deltaproteobacteria bacterium]|nr:hypothetical protein [Deltaproteobacteria bacterium]
MPFIFSDPKTWESSGTFQGRLSFGSFEKAQSSFQENARREEGRLKKGFRCQLVVSYISEARAQVASLSRFLQEVFSPSNFQGHSFRKLAGFLSHLAQNFEAAFRAKIKPSRALFSTKFLNDLKLKIQRANSAESLSFLWWRFVVWWRGNFEGARWNLLDIFTRDPKFLPHNLVLNLFPKLLSVDDLWLNSSEYYHCLSQDCKDLINRYKRIRI